MLKSAHLAEFEEPIFTLTKQVLEASVKAWQETAKIEEWYRENQSVFHRDYTMVIGRLGEEYFSDLEEKLDRSKTFDELVENIPSYSDIANKFRQLSDKFDKFIEKFYYTFYLLYLPGMSGLKGRLIRDINFLLARVVGEIDLNELFEFLDHIFEMFRFFAKTILLPFSTASPPWEKRLSTSMIRKTDFGSIILKRSSLISGLSFRALFMWTKAGKPM